MIEELQERAAKRGMNLKEFIHWRNDLRRDYQQAFDPPAHRPASALPFGWFVGMLDGERVPYGTQSREFYEAREAARVKP